MHKARPPGRERDAARTRDAAALSPPPCTPEALVWAQLTEPPTHSLEGSQVVHTAGKNWLSERGAAHFPGAASLPRGVQLPFPGRFAAFLCMGPSCEHSSGPYGYRVPSHPQC